MNQYNKEELNLLNQILFALFLVADFSLAIHLYSNQFPWLALIGAGIGLAIIVFCWTGKKFMHFVVSLLIWTVVFSIIYNWHTIF